jgi:hypothetical protein
VVFDSLTVVNMKIMIFWVVIPYNLVGINVLGEPAASVFRATLMPINQSVWHITEDSNLEFFSWGLLWFIHTIKDENTYSI